MRAPRHLVLPLSGLGLLAAGALSWLGAQSPTGPDPKFAGLQWTFARIRYDAWTLPPGPRYEIARAPEVARGAQRHQDQP